MPESKNIKFDTVYKQIFGDNNAIVTLKPEIATPDTVSANLNNDTPEIHLNNIDVLTGQLCMITKNYQSNSIDWEINNKGELIVHGDQSKNYHINIDGDLIYTYR